MQVLPQPLTDRGARLLVAHLDSLDPEATPARERLNEQLGNELARKLVFALATRRPSRRAA
jgi:ParB-like chromosome segregation protein Spo0J